MILTFQKYRRSFTLVELLVVIGIIGVMAGMVTYSLAGATTDAKIVRTKGTISKLNNIVLQEWEKFRYRAARIDIDPDMLRPQTSPVDPSLVGQPPISPREGARLRMVVLRDLMRMEMPDRLSDIEFPPISYKVALNTANNAAGNRADDRPYYAGSLGTGAYPELRNVPGKYNNFRRKIGLDPIPAPYGGAVTRLYFSPFPGVRPPNLNTTHQGAEWLYQIVAAANYEGGGALEAFRPSEVGDTDEDGMPEFLDGWGNPIRWLRWPAGYPVQFTLDTPDAMDPIRTDWRWADESVTQKPWLLVPLVVSAGPDGIFDVSFDQATAVEYATQTWSTQASPAYQSGGPYFYPDPYVGVDTGNGLGSLFDEDGDGTTDGAGDNITNYDILLE